ncbi:hypothetical protein GEMRC1_007693 [Eukaryota sp. GEM-RC1]
MLLQGIGSAPDSDKIRVFNSWMASVSNPIFSHEEVNKIIKSFKSDEERLEVLDQISNFFEPLNPLQLIALLKSFSSPPMKVFEVCSQKFAYALAWDCEPIYKIFPTDKKALVRELIAAIPIDPSVESSVPTTLMLLQGIGSAPDSDKIRVLRSWLASVSNPLFSHEEVNKIVKSYKSDEERLEVLPLISNFTESYNVEQVLELIKVFPYQTARPKALSIVAHKLVYHFDSDLEVLHKVFPSTTDKEAAHSIIESLSVKEQGEFKEGEPNIPDLIKRIDRCSQGVDKHRIINSDVFTATNIVLTAQEFKGLLGTFNYKDNRMTALEVLSSYVSSFAVSDVTDLVRSFGEDGEVKVVELCAPKLVYNVPFDCEDLYYQMSSGKTKLMARKIINSHNATRVNASNDTGYPTMAMLLEAIGHEIPDTRSYYERYDPLPVPKSVSFLERYNVLKSWLASVPNPSFTIEEAVELLKDFEDDKEGEVKLCSRLPVLKLVYELIPAPLSIELVKQLLNFFENLQCRRDALLVVAEKMEFQTLWQLEEIIRMFKTPTDREKVRSVLESLRGNQDPTFQIEQHQKVHQSIGQSEFVPELISKFVTVGATESEKFSSLAAHLSSVSEVFLTSETFLILLSFFTGGEDGDL